MTFNKDIAAAHPCFSLGKPYNKGRIHLPVSPGCNIGCRFCVRSLNKTECRPGVAAQIITPLCALEVTRAALSLSPDIAVVGIAGPGDTLATDYAFETFRLIGEEFPQLIKCMSTNGLLLEDRAEELISVGVDTLTVTVNDIFPETLSELCGWVTYKGVTYGGAKGADILIKKQLAGIRLASGAGITVKVNTVLVPEINGGHIGEIAKAVGDAGASVYNIIPLIPQNELAWCAVPSCAEIDGARRDAEKYIRVFRHCRHCRADAVGVPGGEDFSGRIYGERAVAENTFSHG